MPWKAGWLAGNTVLLFSVHLVYVYTKHRLLHFLLSRRTGACLTLLIDCRANRSSKKPRTWIGREKHIVHIPPAIGYWIERARLIHNQKRCE